MIKFTHTSDHDKAFYVNHFAQYSMHRPWLPHPNFREMARRQQTDRDIDEALKSQHLELHDVLKTCTTTRGALTRKLYVKSIVPRHFYEALCDKESKSSADDVTTELLKEIRLVFSRKSEEILEIMETELLLKEIAQEIRRRCHPSSECTSNPSTITSSSNTQGEQVPISPRMLTAYTV